MIQKNRKMMRATALWTAAVAAAVVVVLYLFAIPAVAITSLAISFFRRLLFTRFVNGNNYWLPSLTQRYH
jgi:hypothetical protein